MAIKKNDAVRFTGTVGWPGKTGTVCGFRMNRFHGKQAIVQLDDEDEMYVDWNINEMEKI